MQIRLEITGRGTMPARLSRLTDEIRNERSSRSSRPLRRVPTRSAHGRTAEGWRPDQSPRSAFSGSQDAAGPSRRARDPGGVEAATVVGRNIRRFRARAECCRSPVARCARGLGRCAAVRRDAAPSRLPIHRSGHPAAGGRGAAAVPSRGRIQGRSIPDAGATPARRLTRALALG